MIRWTSGARIVFIAEFAPGCAPIGLEFRPGPGGG
jgi:hypothetical protein